MEITEVRVRKVNSGNRVKAIAQITFDNEFVVHEIKVMESLFPNPCPYEK